MAKRTTVYTDNRDISTTNLILDNGDQVEVDVLELFVNALENAGMSEEHLQEVIDYLHIQHEILVETYDVVTTENDPTGEHIQLTTGLDFLLQALRHPDHTGD